ncbi:hypothetical protein D3C87_241540 [compost metagenome]
MKKISSLVLILMTFICIGAFAQGNTGESQYDEAKEAEIAIKAKKRLYPGGRDEEDLKVQSQLTTPARKLSPQAEVHVESESEE